MKMGMTMSQKILAAHAGLDKVEAGQLINAKLDMVLGNDITSPVAINEFNKAGFDHVFDKTKISLVMDHFVPNKDIKAATQCKLCREFANDMGVINFYDVGDMGVEHALLPEKRFGLRRRSCDWCGLSHLYLRGTRCIFYRRWLNRYGSRNGDR